MGNKDYSPLPQEGDIVLTARPNDDHSEHYTPIPIKPEVYYGDGPFDPPSSDDEEEELLSKAGTPTEERTGRDVEGIGGLKLGGRKVCHWLGDLSLRPNFYGHSDRPHFNA